MTDRHEAECDRVEAEFNGDIEWDPLYPLAPQVKQAIDALSDRIRTLEAKLADI